MKELVELQRPRVVFDLELTAWEGSFRERYWSGMEEFPEVVQIGAVRVEGNDSKITGEFSVLVKPFLNPILSPYFTELTGITQDEVDENGVPFPEAIKQFVDWCHGYNLYCYGFDGLMLWYNCALHRLPPPFRYEQVHSARIVLELAGVPTEKFGSGTVLKAFGAEMENPEGRHNALYDAKVLAEALRLLEKGFPIQINDDKDRSL